MIKLILSLNVRREESVLFYKLIINCEFLFKYHWETFQREWEECLNPLEQFRTKTEKPGLS